jgi:hypothetical protein
MSMTTIEDHRLHAAPTTPAIPRRAPRWPTAEEVEWRRAAGALVVLAGLVAIGAGWFGVSGSDTVWKQVPFVVSGGLGGAALVAIGVALLVSFEHARDRQLIQQLLARMDELEYGLAAELDGVRAELRTDLAACLGAATNGRRTRAT